MGLFVGLYAQVDRIPDMEWKAVFDESLELLLHYPIPLVGLKWSETKHGKRVMFSPVSLRKDDKWGEHWRVEGDAVSGEHGESFILKRGLCEDSPKKEATAVRDILWADKDNLDCFSGHGKTVFNEKTQEFPFHYAMLAVGMLFETRFPGRALVLGDITIEQARDTLNWANGILREPLGLPVVMDEQRMWERLSKAFGDDVDSASIRFSTLYRGAYSELEALIKCRLDSKHISSFVEKQLDGYDSFDTIGAMRTVESLLEAVGLRETLRTLGEIVSLRKGKNKFDFVSLAESLASKFITFTAADKTLAQEMRPSHDSLMNINDTLSNLFAKLGGFGSPDVIDAYIPKDELIAEFAPHVSAHQVKLKRRVDKAVAKCAELIELARKASEQPPEPASGDEGQKSQPKSKNADAHAEGHHLKFDELVRDEAERQRTVTLSPNGWSEIMSQIRNVIQKSIQSNSTVKEIADTDDKDKILDSLYEFVGLAGFAPLESTWELIDAETDLNKLRSLCILSMFKWDEIRKSQMRKYLFDHPEMWPFLVAERDNAGHLLEETTNLLP